MTRASSRTETWSQRLHRLLRPRRNGDLSVVDLYCGAGGLSLGFAAAGFEVAGIDSDPDAVTSYALNLGGSRQAHLDDDAQLETADVLVAGPPCQPWSRAGKQLGKLDARDGFSVVLHATQRVKPSAVIVENVADMSRGQGRDQLDSFQEQLKMLGFAVSEGVFNAADFGVPQRRRRIFVLAVRDDVPIGVPEPWNERHGAGEAIGDTCLSSPPDARHLSPAMDAYIARYERASGCRVPRDLHLDRPARTLTVRNLSGATGDMLRVCLPDGRRRMLTIREAARLQSFPDWFLFCGSRRSQMSQIGNAVPPLLALAVAQQVRRCLAPPVKPGAKERAAKLVGVESGGGVDRGPRGRSWNRPGGGP